MAEHDDDIKKEVEARIKQEAAQMPAESAAPEITSAFIKQCLYANSLGDGTLFAALYRDRFVFSKAMKEWFIWNGHHWRLDDMDAALAAVDKAAEKYLEEAHRVAAAEADKGGTDKDSGNLRAKLLERVRQLRGDTRRTACLKFAHTLERPLAVAGEEFDNKPMLFACANGVVDLETGRLRPGRPGDYLSLASPVEFTGIDTPAPLWEKSLVEIFNKNEALIAYLQRLFGYAITGSVSEKIFPVLYGKTGWNGRSLIAETISYVMGGMAGSIQSEMLLSQKFTKSAAGPSPDVMSLKGLRLALASEIDENQRFSAAKIKWLTGKDELIGRWPNDKRPIRFDPTHKLFVMTNTQPAAPANDKAFWERLHLIPFNISFVNRDPQEAHERRAILDLDRQILKEQRGILAWLIRGCILWQHEGLNPPMEVTEATERYRQDEDMMADFIDECCLREAGAKEKAAVLYARFCEWYHANIGKKEPTGTWFGKQLSQKFEKNKSDGCITYHGICLNGDLPSAPG